MFTLNVEGVLLGRRGALPVIAGVEAVRSGTCPRSPATSSRSAASPTARVRRRCEVQSIRRQWAAQNKMNARGNSIHPGDVRTPQRGHDGEAADAFGVPFDAYVASRQAMTWHGDFTEAEDIAATVTFLISEDGRNFAGAALVVDGGPFNCDSYRPG